MQQEKTHPSSPFPNYWEIKIRHGGSINLPSPAVWVRCICRVHTFPPYRTPYLEALLGALRCGLGAGFTKGRRHWRVVFHFPGICPIQWGYFRRERKQVWVPSPRQRLITVSEFSRGPPRWWGIWAFALWGEAEGCGDVQPRAGTASGGLSGPPRYPQGGIKEVEPDPAQRGMEGGWETTGISWKKRGSGGI